MANFVACHNVSYLGKYDMTKDVKEGGTFLLNTGWTAEELEEKLPAKVKSDLAKKHAKFYTVDGVKIARELGLCNRFSMVLQAAFFKLANIIPIDDAVKYMKEAVVKSFSKKGDDIVRMNQSAIDLGIANLVQINVPAEWANAAEAVEAPFEMKGASRLARFEKKILNPVNAQKGDDCPFPRSQRTRTARSRRDSRRLRSAASRSTFRRGIPKTAFSATSARSYARTPATDLSPFPTRKFPRDLTRCL